MKTLLLIDANALIHRAFHALPPLTTPKGEPIGAIYGLASMLLKILMEQPPDYVAAAFDRPEPTFREQVFKAYKAHRPKAPDELIHQIIKARELFEKLNIRAFETPGFEADDIIATLVKKFSGKNLKGVILTGDLDTLQLVDGERVVVQTPKKGVSDIRTYDAKAVIERFGVKPEQMTDYKGLVGDPSDNIPGVKGIGPKTAAKIIGEFGNLESLYAKASKNHPIAQKLIATKEQALFAKKLATLNPETPLDVELEDLEYEGIPRATLIPYFNELGFQSLVQRISKTMENGQEEHVPKAIVAARENVVFFHGAEDALKSAKKLADKNLLKVACGWKEIIKTLLDHELEVAPPIFDVEIAGWLLDPDQKDCSLAALAKRLLSQELSRGTEEEVLRNLFVFTHKKINECALSYIFESVEMALIPVLAQMEEWGIGVSLKSLEAIEKAMNKELRELRDQIFQSAEEDFNINSHRQVARILFEKLKIETGKKKKTARGQHSTAESVLVKLKDKHPIVNLLLGYRDTFKIKSTYVEPLRELTLVSRDGRIHTNYVQTGTATGRLSSREPNLQNIPQESRWAVQLRSVFEAEAGWSLLSLDYSQLELRLLAHLSGDKNLIQAFQSKKDIHSLTASKIFSVPLQDVSPPMRRVGKTLNFGVVYGMGARAFSETSGLTLQDAEQFIDEYFMSFPQVKEWQEKVKDAMRTFGCVTNVNGRRRYFREALRMNPQAIREAERAAVNMPIQSLNADILKLSMVKVWSKLKEEGVLGSKVRLLLTIHDELLFEVRDDIVVDTAMLLARTMQEAYPLNIPLHVEAAFGKTWGEMEKMEL